jgi:hypothetical protein
LVETIQPAAEPRESIFKLSDGGGLQLWVLPDGPKRCRVAYRFAGSEKTLAIGVYPAIGLREARDAWEEAKRPLAAPKMIKAVFLSARPDGKARTGITERTGLIRTIMAGRSMPWLKTQRANDDNFLGPITAPLIDEE